MIQEIKIKVDFENREIHGIECEYENKFEIAKVLLNIATPIFNKTTIKEKNKIIKPKTNIITVNGNGQ